MSDLGLVRSFSFEDKSLNFWERDGQFYVTAKQVAEALGYSDRRAVSRIHARYRDEFKGGEAGVVKLTTPGGKQDSLCFSPRGAMRVAMHADTDRASAFRDFCLDVLEKLASGDRVLADPAKLMARIESLESALAESKRSHVRALEIGMDSIQSLTKEAFSLIAAALAKRGALKKAEQKLLGEIKSGQRFLVGGEDVAALAPRN